MLPPDGIAFLRELVKTHNDPLSSFRLHRNYRATAPTIPEGCDRDYSMCLQNIMTMLAGSADIGMKVLGFALWTIHVQLILDQLPKRDGPREFKRRCLLFRHGRLRELWMGRAAPKAPVVDTAALDAGPAQQLILNQALNATQVGKFKDAMQILMAEGIAPPGAETAAKLKKLQHPPHDDLEMHLSEAELAEYKYLATANCRDDVEALNLGGRRAGRVKVRGHLLAKTAQQTRKGADLEREIRLRN